MKYFLTLILLFVLFPSALLSQNEKQKYDLIKVNIDSSSGFNYPYYLYIPKSLYENQNNEKKITLLVVPNNTGSLSDSIEFHEQAVKKQIFIWAKIGNKLNTAILMPVFPRTQKNPNIYSHALDRDIFLTDKKEFQRLDLQLIAMIKHSKEELNSRHIKSKDKVWITGFSASGMFANRFTFLHPKLVKAAAIGSPGGWPIAPVRKYKGEKLRYPIGVSDIKLISGKKFMIKDLKKTPLFIYMGEADNNDSVVYVDGYEIEDKNLIFRLFGKTPIDRWSLIEDLYKSKNINATFKLYSGIKHTINNDMIADVVEFFKKSIKTK